MSQLIIVATSYCKAIGKAYWFYWIIVATSYCKAIGKAYWFYWIIVATSHCKAIGKAYFVGLIHYLDDAKNCCCCDLETLLGMCL